MEVVQHGSGAALKAPNGDTLPLKVAQIKASCVKPQHELRRHERYAMSLKLPTVEQMAAHDEEIILCGSGPSLAENLEALKELRKRPKVWLCAIKGTHDWLIERGVIPDFALAVDPLERIANLYRKPDPAIQYLIASQCHPDTFKALKDQKVILWNVYTKSSFEYWQRWQKRKKGKAISFVGGGSTSGLRAIGLFYCLGFRKQHLFGFDSCLGKDHNLLKVTGEKNDGQTMVLMADGQAFICDGAMLCQANEFLPMIQRMPDLRIKAYGEGAIPFMCHQAARKGYEQFLLPDEDFGKTDSPERGSIKQSVLLKAPDGREMWVNPDHLFEVEGGMGIKPEFAYWYQGADSEIKFSNV